MKRRPLVTDPSDVSSLLLEDDNDVDKQHSANDSAPLQLWQPYVGPVRVAWTHKDAATAGNENQNSTAPQRGLVATRDVPKGELLFATLPVLDAAPGRVVELYCQSKDKEPVQQAKEQKEDDAQRSLQDCAEHVLVQAMREALETASRESDDAAKAIAKSFLCLTTGTESNTQKSDGELPPLPTLDRLNGIENDKDGELSFPNMSHNDLLSMIRHNAFGPDGLMSYAAMERELLQQSSSSQSLSSPRLLGLYPLAAMINHSCQANATRVFGRNNVMVAHATVDIIAGDEIGWSYISPTQTWPQRRAVLQEQYGFVCQCQRCCVEGGLYNNNINNNNNNGPQQPSAIIQTLQKLEDNRQAIAVLEQQQQQNSNIMGLTLRREAAAQMLASLQSHKSLSNDAKRYLQISYLPLYIQQLNQASSSSSSSPPQALLLLGMQLHLACVAAQHYASTEHISILHWCYQTVSALYASSTTVQQKEAALPKVRYWTEQLKQAHMVRFGALGQSLETVRRVMKETKELVSGRSAVASRPRQALLL